MNKKIVFSFILIGAFVLVLTGCKSTEKSSNVTVSNSQDSAVTSSQDSTVTDNSGYIGTDKAKEKAFSDIGINESQAIELSVELDNESTYGKVIYEVDFKYNGKEYEYDIDAISGDILNKKDEFDD